MTTLADVAKAAGVSTMTVSNVLAGRSSKVSATTAARVLEAVAATGYVPSGAARSLSGRRSRIVALVINGHGEVMTSTHDARYVGELALALQNRGYFSMLVTATDLGETVASLKSWNVDGAILINTMAMEIDELREAHDVPMLFSDNYSEDPTILTVRADDAAGGRLAAEHLLERGHREATFIGPVHYSVSVDDERWRGFRGPFERAGLRAPDAIQVATTNVVSGIALAEQLVREDRVPAAALCSADDLAAGFLIGLTRAGIRVPEDVSLIGYDGFDISRVTAPGLTTIAQDIGAKAARSVDSLLAAITGAAEPDRAAPLSVSLVERESVRRVGPALAVPGSGGAPSGTADDGPGPAVA
ncbi:LacI family transcriptional regulator [Brachybacterium huguangmaarense]|uniref:LacI family transcriptional regulator n=1 Tax=Brachybacterium huguangmaarense TaxID=1652028 RepID=A0ABY6G444_9MICO|nr:LacI family DNA-binding transcriptional regulator [Brachybacterium huguangmaarense]UYG17877.1 LacI family transcriptional regulator [Brachybacterium huguangmaarense]